MLGTGRSRGRRNCSQEVMYERTLKKYTWRKHNRGLSVNCQNILVNVMVELIHE